MAFKSAFLLSIVLALVLPGTGGASTARNCRELAEAIRTGSTEVTGYDLTGTVVQASYNFGMFTVHLVDDTGFIKIQSNKLVDPALPELGAAIHSTGIIQHHPRNKTGCEIRTLETIGRGAVPEPAEVTIADILVGRHDYREVVATGTVRDAFLDDIDSRFGFFVLADGGNLLFVPFQPADFPNRGHSALIGAKVRVRGFPDPEPEVNRPRIIRNFSLNGPDGVTVLEPAPADPFAAVDFKDVARLPPERLAETGSVRVRGLVTAVWSDRDLLVKTGESEFSRIELEEPAPPAVGDFVEAVGRPTTDLNYINLFRARWRKTDPLPIAENPPRPVAIGELIGYENGARVVHPECSGEAVRLEGELVELNRTEKTLLLLAGGEAVTVHVPGGCDAEPASRLAVTGICLLDSERWSPYAPFPRIRGFSLVVRSSEDIVVLARPPWWTPARVLALVLILVGLLAAAMLWNLLLKRLASRRARELADSEIEQVKAEFKLGERTRLAVELHDSVSQNLTAVGLEIDAARGFFGKNPAEALHHLDVAGTSLQSCRNELRNCLWDLRNQTLELQDFAEAIRQTLAQHLGGARLKVRFPVPREIFTDNTTHNLLRILRELAANAVRHGEASELRVAGAVENGYLSVSLTDNGRGFDPESAPGIDEGHFGLEGIRERVEAMGGEFRLESAPGRGCRAVISIRIPQERNVE